MKEKLTQVGVTRLFLSALDVYLEDIEYGKPIWTLLAESNDDLIRTDPDGNKVQTDYYATWKDEILGVRSTWTIHSSNRRQTAEPAAETRPSMVKPSGGPCGSPLNLSRRVFVLRRGDFEKVHFVAHADRPHERERTFVRVVHGIFPEVDEQRVRDELDVSADIQHGLVRVVGFFLLDERADGLPDAFGRQRLREIREQPHGEVFVHRLVARDVLVRGSESGHFVLVLKVKDDGEGSREGDALHAGPDEEALGDAGGGGPRETAVFRRAPGAS